MVVYRWIREAQSIAEEKLLKSWTLFARWSQVVRWRSQLFWALAVSTKCQSAKQLGARIVWHISKFTRAIVEDKKNSTIFDRTVAIEISYLLLYVNPISPHFSAKILKYWTHSLHPYHLSRFTSLDMERLKM